MSELGSLVVKLGLQDNDFQSGIKRLNSSMKNIQSEFKATTTGLGGFDKALQLAKAKTEMLTKSVNVQREIVKKSEEAYKKSKDTLEKNIQTHEKLKTELTNVKGAYEDSKKLLGENAKATIALKKEYEQLKNEFKESEQKLKSNINTTQNWETKVNNATAKLKGLESELKQSSRELEIQSNKWVQLANKIEPVGKKFSEVGSKVNAVGKGLTAAITVPIAGAGVAAVKMAADFEQGLSNIQSVSNASGEEMTKLKQLALDLGAETKYSAKEAASGIEELMKAGLTTEQVLGGGLKGALSLAAAGEIELKDAAEIASTALNAFKKDALSVGDAADILAGAANASATDVGELKYGLSMCSAVASGVGLTFKDTATALALFAQNGLKGSDAGTSLKTMLLNLQPKTDKAYAEFERLGLMTYNAGKAMEFLKSRGIKATGNSFEELDPKIRKYVEVTSGAKIGTAKFDNAYREFTQQIGASQSVFYDNNGKLKSMAEISGILKDKLSGLNDAQRQMALNTMFGTDAIRAANILFNEGAEGANKMATEMSKITADETARIKMDNLKGAIEEMMGSLETAAIKIGEKAIPTIKGLAQTINSLSDKFLELSPWQQDAIIKFGLFAAAAGPVLMIVGSIGTGIGTLTTAFKGLSGVVAGLTAANGIAGVGTAAATASAGVASVGGAATIASGGFGVLGNVLTKIPLLCTPAGLAIAGVGTAVVMLGSGLYKSMKEEAIPSIDLFADKVQLSSQQIKNGSAVSMQSVREQTITISEETKKAVQAYLDMDKSVSNSLMSMQMTNQKITQNIAKDMTSKFSDMGKTITNELKKDYDNDIKVAQEFFARNIALTSEEMANINSIIKNNYDQQVYEVEQANNKINQIISTAAKENRSITVEEMEEITACKNTMKTNAVKALSEQESESQVILDRMANYDRRVTAEMASEHVKQLNDARDKAVDAANKEYNETVAIAEKMKVEGGAEARELADKMINEAERQKNNTIASANEIREKGIKELSKSYAGLEKDIDTDTAQIKSHWDKAIAKIKEFFGLPSEKHFKVTTTYETIGNYKVAGGKAIGAGGGHISEAARGTRLAGHRGGPLITSEKGRELAILPSGQMFLTGNSGSEFWPHMPKGTHIIPNMETEKILRRKGVPGYAKGTGLKLGNNYSVVQGKMDFENANDELTQIKKVDRELYTITSRLLREFRNDIPQAISETNKAFDSTKEKYKAKSDEEIKVLEEQLKEVERQEKIDKRNAELDKQALQNRKSEIKKVLDAEIKAINSQKNIKDSIKKQQIEELRKERNQEIAEIDRLLQNKKTINKYALEDEYTAKKESIRRQIEERKNQIDEEIKELERLEKAYLEKLQAEEEARRKFVDEINSLVSDLSTALKNKYSKMQQEAEASLNKEIEVLDNWQKESIDRINSVYDAKIKAIDEASNAQIAAINAEIKALEEGQKQEDREEINRKELQNISNIQDSIDYEHDEYNKKQLEKELEKAISDRNKRLKQLEIEDKKASLQEQANLIREDAEKKKQQLELQKQEELLRLNQLYESEKLNLNDRLTQVREFYAKKLEDANIQAEAEKLIIDNNQKEILNLLENYSDAYRQRGETLGQMLIDGFKPKLAELEAMIDTINAKITAARESAVAAMVAAESTVNNIDNSSTTNNSTVNNINVTSSSNNDISRQVEYALKRVTF